MGRPANFRTNYQRIYNWPESIVVDLKTYNVNTGASVSDSKVESISVARGNGKECCVDQLANIKRLLNMLYTSLIVCDVFCCCVISFIPLIGIHVKIESVTVRKKSTFPKIGTDIDKHLCSLVVFNILGKEPVVLWCTTSEIT